MTDYEMLSLIFMIISIIVTILVHYISDIKKITAPFPRYAVI